MQEAILDRERAQPSVVQLPAQLEHARAVVRMQALQPELDRLEPLLPVGREAAEVTEAVVDEGGPFVEVHLVVAQAVEVGGGRVAGFAGAQRLVRAPPSERVGEDLRDQSQAPHEFVRPVAFCPQRIQAPGRRRRETSRRQRDGQIRPEPEQTGVLPVRDRLRRQCVRKRRQDDDAAGEHFLYDPRKLVLAHRRGRGRTLLPEVDVGGHDHARHRARPLPEQAEIDVEMLAHPLQRIANLAVDVGWRQIHEP